MSTLEPLPGEVEEPEFYAATHAAAGYAVFPCNPDDKTPITSRGHMAASTDPTLITMWWDTHPTALVGVRVPRNVAVIDVDPRNGGEPDALRRAVGDLPETFTVWSGRGDGGRHLYFRLPDGAGTVRGKVPGTDGIDVKAQGRGYVIGWGSLHPATGEPYRRNSARLAMLPPAAVRVLTTSTAPLPAGTGALFREPAARAIYDRMRTRTEERNAFLYWASCRYAEMDAPEWAWLRLAEAAIESGLDPREIDKTMGSARRKIGGQR